MYLMCQLDYLRLPVRVDEVTVVNNKHTGHPELSVLATVILRSATPTLDRPAHTVQLILWAQAESASAMQPSDEFVMREVIVEGYGPPKDSPHKPGPVGLKAIWFDDPTDTMLGAVLGQVRRAADVSERDALLQLMAMD